MLTRRDFGKIALASVPMAAWAAKVNGVTLGVMTYSYRALPQVPGTDRVDGAIEALRTWRSGARRRNRTTSRQPGRNYMTPGLRFMPTA
jgi:hypothetical protein